MKQIFTLIAIIITNSILAQQITEIYYDNSGTDANERIEVTVPVGTDITGWNIVLYNGTGGVTYDTDLVSSGTMTTEGSFNIYVISYPANGIQNGAPDAVALVDAANTVIQFLSYEGTLTATNGPASGTSSTDMGASESGTGISSGSLQLNTATGIWSVNNTQNSFGALNDLLLPVKIENFKVENKNNGNTFSWKVTAQLNIKNYEIERSLDGINFTKIATVDANKNSWYNYSFFDNTQLKAVLYYRLKINEQTNQSFYSAILKINNITNDISIINIAPNPATSNTNILVVSNLQTKAMLNIINSYGQNKLQISTNLSKGNNTINLEVAQLTAGIYFLEIITSNNNKVTQKIIVK